MVNVATVLLLLLLGTGMARGATLSELVDAALQNNPGIAAAKAKWDAAKARASGSRALPDPMIGADFERADSTDFSDYNDIEYMVQQDLPWFGKRGLAGRVEEGAARGAEMEFRMKSLEVASQVKRTYYDLWQARGELDLNKQTEVLLEQAATAARTLYEGGKVPQSDVLRADTELAMVTEDRVDKARAIDVANAEMARLLGRDVDITPVDLPEPFELATDAFEARALAEQPGLRAAREGEIASAKAALDLARKTSTPDFQLRVEARQFEESGSIDEYDTGIFLSLPWFNRRRNASAAAEAKGNVTRAEMQYEAMRQQTAADVRKLAAGIHAMHHHYELYRDRILPLRRATEESARAAYVAGQVPLLDLLDAQRMLLDAEMLNLHHRAEFHRLVAELEPLVGSQLENLP